MPVAIFGLVGGAFQTLGQGRQARKARRWSERMSNTAYQRMRADMKAANLNPILGMKSGGASTPGASMAAMTGLEAGAQTAVSNAQQAKLFKDTIRSEKARLEADLAESAERKRWASLNAEADADTRYFQSLGARYSADALFHQLPALRNQAELEEFLQPTYGTAGMNELRQTAATGTEVLGVLAQMIPGARIGQMLSRAGERARGHVRRWSDPKPSTKDKGPVWNRPKP